MGTSSTFLPGFSFSNCFLMPARNSSITLMELSVDCLKETFRVSGSLPEPELHAVREVAVRAAARSAGSAERTAVGRTGMTSYGLTWGWPGGCPVNVGGVV